MMSTLRKQFAEDIIFELQSLLTEAENKEKRNNNIFRLRLLFEQICKEVTAESEYTFQNLFSRYTYVASAFHIPDDLDGACHYVRRLANKAAHEKEFTLNKIKYIDAVITLSRLTSFLANLPLPEALTIPLSKKYFKAEAVNQQDGELIPLFHCIFMQYTEKTVSAGKQYIFECVAEETGLPVIIVHQFSQKSSVSQAVKMLRKYRTVLFHNIVQLSGTENHYTATDISLLIIEPDFLVDVTSIAECFDVDGENYLRYFSLLYKRPGTTESLLKGLAVNGLLDALTVSPDKTVDDVLDNFFKENALQSAAMGERIINTIQASIKQFHLKNIEQLIRDYAGNDMIVEPTFISPKYGIQGRLDLYIHRKENPAVPVIVELKSGKPPGGNSTWRGHDRQTQLYKLLITSVLGEKVKPLAGILYSGADRFAQRFTADTQLDTHTLMSVRNAIVSVLFALAEGRYTLFPLLAREEFAQQNRFDKPEYYNFINGYNSLTQKEKKYYHQFIGFILRELIASKNGNEDGRSAGFSSLWKESIAEKRSRFAILTPLQLLSYDSLKSEITFSFDTTQQYNFRTGDVVIIYRCDNDRSPTEQQIIKGTFLSVAANTIVFRLRNTQLAGRFLIPDTHWSMEQDLFDSSKTELNALSSFITAGEDYRSLLMGDVPPEFSERPFIPDPELNENQNHLLRAALSANDYFLLQGPPGTGKTSKLLPAIVSRLLNEREEHIYILGFTNRSVEEIVQQLRKHQIPFLRLGNTSVEDDEMLHNLAANKSVDELRRSIITTRVIVSTVASFYIKSADIIAIKKEALPGTKAGICIIDEASQLTEPQVVGLLHNFRPWILIGDQNQLPAVVTQDERSCRIDDEELNESGLTSCTVSLFERLMRLCRYRGWNNAFGMLEYHYRMHSEIAELINPYYNNRLQVGHLGQTQSSIESDIPLLPVEQRVIFVPTDITEASRVNYQEAERVVKCIQYLHSAYGDTFDTRTLGVVTPWRAQIALIKFKLSQAGLAELPITIDTVERFQGAEKNIIIVSLSINFSSQVWSLESRDIEGRVDRKMVVALSRAKDQLLIFGHPELLNTSVGYSRLIQQIKSTGGYLPFEQLKV